jgi:hypothetical protein
MFAYSHQTGILGPRAKMRKFNQRQKNRKGE